MSNFVGCCEITIVDERKDLTFPMLAMYPTYIPSKPVTFGPYSLDVSIDAPVEDGSFPLVMISHGSGGSNLAYRTLGMHLAKNGFVVCLPEHPFNNRNNNALEGSIENMIDRPRHISLAINNILSNDRFKKFLQMDNVAVIGHSMGGYTALALTGGIPHTKHQINYEPTCKIHSQQIDVVSDSRIKAVVLFAPAAGWFMSDGALRNVHIPVLMFTAEHDEFTPYFHAEIIMNGISGSSQLSHRVVKNAGHFSFLGSFPESIKHQVGAPAKDPKDFDRDKFHQELNFEVLEFLQKTLVIDG